MLMPSFCCPLVVGPKLAMTRPFAGQRNFGRELVPSAVFRGSLPGGFSATGVNMLALGVISGSFGRAIEPPLASATATGGWLADVADVRIPGMIRRSPTFSRALA